MKFLFVRERNSTLGIDDKHFTIWDMSNPRTLCIRGGMDLSPLDDVDAFIKDLKSRRITVVDYTRIKSDNGRIWIE
jgi:hypothetical protein